jgi:azurin
MTGPVGAAVVGDGAGLLEAAALDGAAADEVLAAALDTDGLPPDCPRLIVATTAPRIPATPIQTITFCRRFRRRRASLNG